MEVALRLLRQWEPAIEAATLIAVIVYVWKTWSMAREMRLSREEQSKPYIVCYFEHNKDARNCYDFVIKNFGNSMAFDVRLVFLPELTRLIPYNRLKEKTFKALAPGCEWRTYWDSFVGRNPSIPDQFVSQVSYRWGPHRKLQEYEVSFDSSSLMGTLSRRDAE